MAEVIVFVPGKRGFPSESEDTPLHQKQNELQIRPKPNSSLSISEDTIQNTSSPMAGVFHLVKMVK
jgi:hypothetical protein